MRLSAPFHPFLVLLPALAVFACPTTPSKPVDGDTPPDTASPDTGPQDTGLPADHAPSAQFLVPDQDGLLFWEGLTAEVRARIVDPDDDLMVVDFLAETPEGDLFLASGYLEFGTPGEFVAGVVPPPGTTRLLVQATDARANQATDTVPITLAPCAEAAPLLRWLFDGDLADASGAAHHGALLTPEGPGLGTFGDGLFLGALDTRAEPQWVEGTLGGTSSDGLTFLLYVLAVDLADVPLDVDAPLLSVEAPDLSVRVGGQHAVLRVGDAEIGGPLYLPADGAWHQVVVTLTSDGRAGVWVDGNKGLEGEFTPAPFTLDGGVLWVGGDPEASPPFTGLLDDLTVLPAVPDPSLFVQLLGAATGFCL